MPGFRNGLQIIIVALVTTITSAQAGTLSAATRSETLLRAGYRSFNEGKLSEATTAFSKVLKLKPEHEEARVRKMEADLYLGRFDEHARDLVRLRTPRWREDGLFIIARGRQKQGQHREALRYLSAISSEGKTAAVRYWQGVSQAALGEREQALTSFNEVIEGTHDGDWIREAAEPFRSKLARQTRRYSMRLDLGTFHDSNPAQSQTVYKNLTSYDASVFAFEDQRIEPSSDTGNTAAVTARAKLSQSESFLATAGLTGSGTWYNNLSNMNSQSFGPMASVGWFGRELDGGANASFTDLRFQYRPFQNYTTLAPWLNWRFAPALSLRPSLSMTRAAPTRPSMTYSPALQLQWSGSRAAIWLGAGYSRTEGDKAVYSQSEQALLAGAPFSRYDAYSLVLGGSVQLSSRLSLSGQLTYKQTQFEEENYPKDTAFLGGADGARRDQLINPNAKIEYAVVRDVLYANVTYSYMKNISSGQRYLLSFPQIIDYNFERQYLLMGLTLTP